MSVPAEPAASVSRMEVTEPGSNEEEKERFADSKPKMLIAMGVSLIVVLIIILVTTLTTLNETEGKIAGVRGEQTTMFMPTTGFRPRPPVTTTKSTQSLPYPEMPPSTTADAGSETNTGTEGTTSRIQNGTSVLYSETPSGTVADTGAEMNSETEGTPLATVLSPNGTVSETVHLESTETASVASPSRTTRDTGSEMNTGTEGTTLWILNGTSVLYSEMPSETVTDTGTEMNSETKVTPLTTVLSPNGTVSETVPLESSETASAALTTPSSSPMQLIIKTMRVTSTPMPMA